MWRIDNQRKATDVKITKCWRQSNGKEGFADGWERPSTTTRRQETNGCRRYSQTIRHQQSTSVTLRTKVASHRRTNVVTNSLLAVVFSSLVVDNDYQRNCDDLKTTKDGIARHGNVKEMRVAVCNEIWTESQRIVLPLPNFQHAENLPTNATDNIGRLRSLANSSATIDGNTRWLAGNSKLQFAA